MLVLLLLLALSAVAVTLTGGLATLGTRGSVGSRPAARSP